MSDFDWTGFERGSRSIRMAFVRCERCAKEWVLAKCMLREPSPQCLATWEQHRQECHPPADVPKT